MDEHGGILTYEKFRYLTLSEYRHSWVPESARYSHCGATRIGVKMSTHDQQKTVNIDCPPFFSHYKCCCVITQPPKEKRKGRKISREISPTRGYERQKDAV